MHIVYGVLYWRITICCCIVNGDMSLTMTTKCQQHYINERNGAHTYIHTNVRLHAWVWVRQTTLRVSLCRQEANLSFNNWHLLVNLWCDGSKRRMAMASKICVRCRFVCRPFVDVHPSLFQLSAVSSVSAGQLVCASVCQFHCKFDSYFNFALAVLCIALVWFGLLGFGMVSSEAIALICSTSSSNCLQLTVVATVLVAFYWLLLLLVL